MYQNGNSLAENRHVDAVGIPPASGAARAGCAVAGLCVHLNLTLVCDITKCFN